MFIKKQRMIELQNVNLRLRAGGNVKKRNWYLILGMLLLVQLIAIFYFGSKKAGFHYDEYYSYYSSNVSIGLVPTDREWKPGQRDCGRIPGSAGAAVSVWDGYAHADL